MSGLIDHVVCVNFAKGSQCVPALSVDPAAEQIGQSAIRRRIGSIAHLLFLEHKESKDGYGIYSVHV